VIRKDENQEQSLVPRNMFKTGLQPLAHQPPALKATLKFTERILFQSRSSLEIEFHETPLKELQGYIQKKCSDTRHQIITTRAKLSALLQAANSKNLGLFALLDRPSRNTKFETKPPPLVDQYHRYGYEGNRVTKYQESDDDDVVDDYQNALGPTMKLIPQRTVATMGISVQAAMKNDHIGRLHKSDTKTDLKAPTQIRNTRTDRFTF
jgi:hypothetical protein